jgi:DNA-binding transcriptional MerR regulator
MQSSEESEQQPFTLSSEKIFYKIGEVSKITGLETHVIRYWETVFPQLRPKKGSTGQRFFQKKDIELLLYIKHLQDVEGYTLEGIKKRLTTTKSTEIANMPAQATAPIGSVKEVISLVKSRLLEILRDIK